MAVKTASVSMIVEFIHYNNWANQRVLEACQKLSDEQLAATAPGTYGTIRDTLEHIIRSEARYVALLTGERPLAPFKWEDKPNLAAMTAYADQVGEALVEAVSHINPTDTVRQEWQGETVKYKAMAIFIQIVNHGIEHRTNITTILDSMKLAPPDVDGWGYLWANLDRLGEE